MRAISLHAWICVAALFQLSVLSASRAPASEAPSGSPGILVKLRSDGPNAVRGCAEASFRAGGSPAGAADSLDRLQRELGVRSVRAVFRRPDGSSLAAQRERLRHRLEAARARSRRARADAPLPDLSHVYRFELAEGQSPAEAAARFRADPHVVYAQPNHPLTFDAAPIDDPFVTSSGSWGQSYPDQWGLHLIDAPRAWETSLGEGVVVAVVDSGVDFAHEDLAANLWVNPGEDLDGDGIAEPEDRNGLDDDGNGFVDDLRGWDFQGGESGDADPQDENGHGTHVAGIAAARGGNGIGISGVAPRATVMPVRVFPAEGGAPEDLVYRGVLYAALNGADVINASFSCGVVCRDNPVAEEVVGIAAELGVAYVTSAGNESADVMLKTPERLRSSIVVGAVEPTGSLASFSSFGVLVDVVAPGQDVLSLAASAARDHYAATRFVGERYMRLSGTSMSAPHVAGVLALLLSADPELSPEALRARLHASAGDLGEAGPDPVFGRGLVAPADALAHPGVAELVGGIGDPLGGDTLADAVETEPVTGSAGGADLADWTLELGAGNAPDAWTPLASGRGPVEEAELGRLPVGSLGDGPYILRLRLSGRSGSEAVEFAPIALERNPLLLLSDGASEARNPVIEGRRVIFDAVVPDADAGTPVRQLRSIFFGRGRERALSPSPGDQHEAAFSAGSVAWLEGSPEEGDPDASRIVACSLRGSGGCEPRAITEVAARHSDLQLSGDRLAVLDLADGRPTLRGCRLRGATCVLRELVTGVPFHPEFPVLDAPRLVFGISAIPGGLYSCLLDAEGSACPADPVDLGEAFEPWSLALSGRTLVFRARVPPDGPGLFVCTLGDDLRCGGIRIASLLATDEIRADASGRRIVWEAPGSHGERDVFFCEFDPASGTCPAQRITSDAADQEHPRLDGRRLTFEDFRSGEWRIAGFELPAIAAPASARFRAGTWNTLTVRVLGAREAEIVAMAPPEAEGLRLEQPAPGTAILSWRPQPDAIGIHPIRLRATLPSGLFTEREIAITVVRN